MGYLDRKFKWKASLGLQQVALFGKIMEPLRGGASLEEVRHWWVGLKNLCPGSLPVYSPLLNNRCYARDRVPITAWHAFSACYHAFPNMLDSTPLEP